METSRKMEGGSVSSLQSISSARTTPVPMTYKPISHSTSLLSLISFPDDEIRQKSKDELLHIIRRFEGEYHSVVSEHSNIMKDVNKKMQILLIEIKGLKDINQNLQDDNQELRDLCCFLDDDRQRGRKLAREWQRFGRYTASVMRSEVSVYQEKLSELEQKQQELILENLELKELCLYLDQERLRLGQIRDEGDGSSNSTLAGNEEHLPSDGIELVPVSHLNNAGERSTNTAEYIHQLDEKNPHFDGEQEKSANTQVPGSQRLGPDGVQAQDTVSKTTSTNKPEAVVHAMKVLEVHENLERPQTSVGEENLGDKEKAIVREMCNVVWRKLGNVSADQTGGDSESSTPCPVYENFHPSQDKNNAQDQYVKYGGRAVQNHPQRLEHEHPPPNKPSLPVRYDTPQRPPPSPGNPQQYMGRTPQQPLQPPSSQDSASSKAPMYGYVLTSYPARDSPSIQQRSQSPALIHHSTPVLRTEPANHSPRPRDTGQHPEGQRSRSNDSQPYQGVKKDHSYENIRPSYHSSSSSVQAYDVQQQSRPKHSGDGGYDYTNRAPQRSSSSNYINTNNARQNHPSSVATESGSKSSQRQSASTPSYQKLQKPLPPRQANTRPPSTQQGSMYPQEKTPLPPYPSHSQSGFYNYQQGQEPVQFSNGSGNQWSGDRKPPYSHDGNQQYRNRQTPRDDRHPNNKYYDRPFEGDLYVNRPDPHRYGDQQYGNQQDHAKDGSRPYGMNNEGQSRRDQYFHK